MAYCTIYTMRDRFGNVEMDQFSAEAKDKAIIDAAAEIDDYIGARYDLPLSPTPESLGRVSCDIARYRLYTEQPTEEVRQRYEDAVDWLRSVSKGLISLGVVRPAANNFGVSVASRAKVFTTDMLGLMP